MKTKAPQELRPGDRLDVQGGPPLTVFTTAMRRVPLQNGAGLLVNGLLEQDVLVVLTNELSDPLYLDPHLMVVVVP